MSVVSSALRLLYGIAVHTTHTISSDVHNHIRAERVIIRITSKGDSMARVLVKVLVTSEFMSVGHVT